MNQVRNPALPPLSGKQSRHLRALAHPLRPVVFVGKAGLTTALLAEAGEALLAHELIKVKVATDAPLTTKEAGPELAQLLGARLAQTIGHVVVLYRPHPKKPQIALPKAGD